MDSSEILKRKAAFDDYAHEEEGVEYWLAREIMKPLGYARWENFQEAIRRAAVSCEESKTPAQNHFRETTKTIPMPKGASRTISDFKLTRYACYLIAINGDPTGVTGIKIDRAFTICDALDCTPNDLSNWYEDHPRPSPLSGYADRRQQRMNAAYELLDETSKDQLSGFAETMTQDVSRLASKRGQRAGDEEAV